MPPDTSAQFGRGFEFLPSGKHRGTGSRAKQNATGLYITGVSEKIASAGERASVTLNLQAKNFQMVQEYGTLGLVVLRWGIGSVFQVDWGTLKRSLN